jgi:hypothetical protein
VDGPGEGLPSVALRGSILVAPAGQDGRFVIELDDRGNLYNGASSRKSIPNFLVSNRRPLLLH